MFPTVIAGTYGAESVEVWTHKNVAIFGNPLSVDVMIIHSLIVRHQYERQSRCSLAVEL